MVANKDIWAEAQETLQAFTPFYQQAMGEAIQSADAQEGWGALLMARGADPEPLTLQRFNEVSPYTEPGRDAEVLRGLAEKGALELTGEDAYRLTDSSRRRLEAVFGLAHEKLGAIEPLPAKGMAQLNGLLERLVQAALEADQPERKWSLAQSRKADPGEEASPCALTDQYLTDLYYFRDDAHTGSWKPLGVSGPLWETLSLIWQEEASDAEGVLEKRPNRGYSAEDYAGFIEDLAGRGWLEKTDDGYQVTQKGRALREEAEEATDRMHFGPWEALSQSELDQLHSLLSKLKGELQMLAESLPETAA